MRTMIDNNTIDGKMLRYHDFELIPPKNQNSSVTHSHNIYKQAYLKYQSEIHNRQHSIPSRSKFGSEVSPSRFSNVRSVRGTKKGKLSLSNVGKLPNHQSALITNRSRPRGNIRIPEYKGKEYVRRDFSPYIQKFLQNQHNQSPKNMSPRQRMQRAEPQSHSLLNQLQEYPSAMKSNNSVTLTSERKRVWIPSGNP